MLFKTSRAELGDAGRATVGVVRRKAVVAPRSVVNFMFAREIGFGRKNLDESWRVVLFLESIFCRWRLV